jgi:NAD(P)-dependent dehydrogenase (short-subunit alcohol dehydrogenase family)
MLDRRRGVVPVKGNSMDDLNGRIILVAGATGSIGKAVAKQLAAAGASVILHGFSPSKLEPLAVDLGSDGAEPAAVECADLRDLAATRAMFARIAARCPRLDGLVNCVQARMEGVVGRFEEVDPEKYPERILGSLLPLMHLCHAAIPLLRAAGKASIVTFASDAGKVAFPGQSLTGPVMAGIIMFTRTIALELSGDGIRANCISPTFVRDTEVYDRSIATGPQSRALSAEKRARLGLPGPDDLAQLARFLCGDGAAHLTGQVISVNGGLSAA